MKLEDLKEIPSKIGETIPKLVIASLETRAKGLEEAVKEGWFKNYLIGAGLIGAGLVYSGLKNDNDFMNGLGHAILFIDSIYAIECYGIPFLRKLRDYNKE